VLERAEAVRAELAARHTVKLDDRDQYSPGWKFNEWELKGVPIRIELGPRDLRDGQAVLVRRDTRDKRAVPFDALAETVASELDAMQRALFDRAKAFREANTRLMDDYDAFKAQMNQAIPGFVHAHWCGSAECEAAIQAETRATIRCIPAEHREERGACIRCGAPSKGRVVMDKAY